MVTKAEVVTVLVFTVKVAVVAPAGTITLDGTVATLVSLLERDTTASPLGAGPLSITVPVEEFPPVTLDGLSVSDERVDGVEDCSKSQTDGFGSPSGSITNLDGEIM